MRKIILSILLLVSLRLAVSGQEVKIVHFGVGHGDCTLIVIKDCTDNSNCANTMRQVNILIDASERGAKKVLGAVKQELDPQGKGYQIDFLIISHFDDDHYTGAQGVLNGVRADAKKTRGVADRRERMAMDLEEQAKNSTREDVRQAKLAQAKKLREEAANLRASVAWVGTMIIYDRKSLYDNPPTARKWVLPKPEIFDRRGSSPKKNTWLLYTEARNPFEMTKIQTPLLLVGKDILENYKLKNVEMVCIASNGSIGKLEGRKLGTEEKAKASTQYKGEALSENDLSFAFLLRFGSFRYFTGGDLCGSEERGLCTNMEDPLATWVQKRWKDVYGEANFHVCAAKINHHGANRSTNMKFLEVFDPRLAVISAGNRDYNKKGEAKKILPDEQTIVNLLGVNFPIPKNTTRKRPVFFTFRLGTNLDPTQIKYQDWLNVKEYASPPAVDIILLVKKEADGSPLVDGKPPQINIFSRKRERKTLKLEDKTAKPFVIPEGQGENKNTYFCDRNDAHKPVVLPAFGPAAPPSSPKP